MEVMIENGSRKRSWQEEKDVQYELPIKQAFMSHRELETGGVMVVVVEIQIKECFAQKCHVKP